MYAPIPIRKTDDTVSIKSELEKSRDERCGEPAATANFSPWHSPRWEMWEANRTGVGMDLEVGWNGVPAIFPGVLTSAVISGPE